VILESASAGVILMCYKKQPRTSCSLRRQTPQSVGVIVKK